MSRFYNATPTKTVEPATLTIKGHKLTAKEIEAEIDQLLSLAATKPQTGEGMSYREQKTAINLVKGLYNALDYFSKGIRGNSKATNGQTMPDRLAAPGDHLSELATQLKAAIVADIKGGKATRDPRKEVVLPATATREPPKPYLAGSNPDADNGIAHWTAPQLFSLLKQNSTAAQLKAWRKSGELAHPRSLNRKTSLLALLK